VIEPPRPASEALRTALLDSIAAARTCTIASSLVHAGEAEGSGLLMAPYPHCLMVVVDMTEDYAERLPVVTEAIFDNMSKSDWEGQEVCGMPQSGTSHRGTLFKCLYGICQGHTRRGCPRGSTRRRWPSSCCRSSSGRS
jgi:hypothetical protein